MKKVKEKENNAIKEGAKNPTVSPRSLLHYVFVGSKTYTIENANFFPHAPILLKHGSF